MLMVCWHLRKDGSDHQGCGETRGWEGLGELGAESSNTKRWARRANHLLVLKTAFENAAQRESEC